MTAGAQELIPGQFFDFGGAVYNVKHLDFGAVGDGAVNDTTAIQLAIDTASAGGGGFVFIPEGLYLCSQLQLESHVHVVGSGWKTIIKQIAPVTLDLIILAQNTTDQSGMRDLKLDGNKANQSAANNGITLTHSGSPSFETNDPMHIFHNLFIINCKGFGIEVLNASREILFDRIQINNCDLNNFQCRGTDNLYINCTSQASGQNGFRCADPGSRFINCKSFGNGDDGFDIDQDNQQLIGCAAQDNDEDGFHLNNARDCILSACIADRNGVDAAKTDAAGFHIQFISGSGGQKNIITGCIATNSTGSTQNYSLRFSGATSIGNRIDIISILPATADQKGAGEGNVVSINQNMSHGGILLRNQLIHSKYGTAGSSDDEHLRFGKTGSPASNNPYYVFKTGLQSVPVGSLQGFDNTNTQVYFEVDYNNALLTLGVGGPSGVVNVKVPVFTTGQLPTPGTEGRIAFNTTTNEFVFDDGTNWVSPAGIGIGSANQMYLTNAGGTAAAWESDLDIPGLLDVVGVSTLAATTLSGILTINGQTLPIAMTNAGNLVSFRLTAGAGNNFGLFDDQTQLFRWTTTSTGMAIPGTLTVDKKITGNHTDELIGIDELNTVSGDKGDTVRAALLKVTQDVASIRAVLGMDGQAESKNGSGTQSGVVAAVGGLAKHSGGGTVNDLIGVQGTGFNSGSGTVVDLVALRAKAGLNTGGGTVTNNIGLHVENQTVGTNDHQALFDNPTESLAFDDAGSASATQQDWIEVEVGGNTGFIHVFATK